MLRVVEVATQKQIQSKIGLDFNYAIAYSEKKIKDVQVFSDGYWTYIRLAENIKKYKELPLAYSVKDGADVLVNTRYVNGYLIIEAIPNVISLLFGEETMCVVRGI